MKPASSIIAAFIAALTLMAGGTVEAGMRAQPGRVAVVNYATQAITVDGFVDDGWSVSRNFQLTNLLSGSAPSAANLSASYRMLYDTANLYVLMTVDDSAIVGDTDGARWQDDSVELYLDSNYSRGTTYDADDRHFIIRFNDNGFTNGVFTADVPDGTKLATRQVSNGYKVEMSFPLAGLGISPQDGGLFGLDFMVNDDDNGGLRDRNLAWNMTTDIGYERPSVFGTGLFGEAPVATPTATRTAVPATPTRTPTAAPQATATKAPATSTPVAPTTPAAATATPFATVQVTVLPPVATLDPRSPRRFLPLMASNYPPHNTTQCTALRLVPPVAFGQAANQPILYYSIVATKASYEIRIPSFPSTGSVVLLRVDENRCVLDGTLKQTLIGFSELQPGRPYAGAFNEVFEIGKEYLVVVYTTGALSQNQFEITIR